MAENRSESNSSKRKKSRRRYFRRKKRTGTGQESGSAAEQSEKQNSGGSGNKSAPGGKSANGDQRPRRRRRRRSKRNTGPEFQIPDVLVGDLTTDYIPPDDVFVYTHVLRPNLSGGGYEYRSENFPSSGRRIEDFNIDLSGIIGTILIDDPVEPSEEEENSS